MLQTLCTILKLSNPMFSFRSDKLHLSTRC